MKKRLSIFLLFLLVMTGGCNGKEQMPEEIVFCSPLILCKDGILYCSDLLYITDYITGATVPLCDKPNCAHELQSSTNENPQCNAAYPGFISSAFLYQDKLYVFVSEGLNHTSVYMAESTGEGRRKIAETDYMVLSISEFQDGKAYFPAWREHYQEDDSLRQEREEFIALFDTAEQRFEYLTTPDLSMGGMAIYGITSEEIFFQQYSILEAEKVSDWRDIHKEYIAKNLETGEERYFSDGTVDRIGDFCVVENGFYYWLEKDGICELWKKETEGDEILICSADFPSNMRPIINGEPVLDKSDFQKELIAVGTCGDMILILDGRKGVRHGIITIDNYLGDIDEIVYPEFPNVTYID